MSVRLCVLASIVAGAQAWGQVTLNPSGGTTANNGIRVTIGNSGQLQVLRNNAGQFFSPLLNPGATTALNMSNGVYLAVGSNVFGPRHFAIEPQTDAGVVFNEFTPVSNTVTPQPDGSGTAISAFRAVVAGRNYDVTVTYNYTFPNDFVTVNHSVVVPAGNTQSVRLYHALDAYLGGNDEGPSFASAGPPTMVGAYRPSANVVEAWRYRTGLAWSGYYAGFYECLFRSAICPGILNNSIGAALAFNNYVEPTSTDNGFGIMWNLGAQPGTFNTSNDLSFFSYQPQLRKAFAVAAINASATTALTFTIDNVPGSLAQSGMAFTDRLPAGLTVAGPAVSNSCGGSLTTESGGALSAGSTSIRLVGGVFAAGQSKCTVVVNVGATAAGAYVNGPGNMAGLAVVQSQVSPQTLSVIVGAPVVSLTAPGVINAGNAATYTVRGTCQDSNGPVAVSVGSASLSVPCSAGAFEATLNVGAVADAVMVSVRAAQTNGSGTGESVRATSKDTSAPSVPAVTVPVAGAFTNDNTPTVSGTAEPGARISVFVGAAEVCTAVSTSGGSWSCVATSIPDGTPSFTATATDAAGNASPATPPRSITVDTQAPAAPVITSPAASSQVGMGPAVSGNAEPGATVTVRQTTTMALVCTATADGSGQWSCGSNLTAGSYAVVATQADRATNVSPASPSRAFSVANVPTVTLDAPAPINSMNRTAYPVAGACSTGFSVTVSVGTASSVMVNCTGSRFSATVDVSTVADATAVSVTAAQTNASGTGTDVRSTSKDVSSPTAPTVASPTEGSFINDASPTLMGTAEPGATLRVMRGSTMVCQTVVPMGGLWSCVAMTLPASAVSVVATQVDAAGNTSAGSATRSFTVDTNAPLASVITSPANMAQTAPSPTVSGTGEALATVSVFEGAALVCTVIADASGGWSCPTTLGTGTRVLTTSQRDRAGNTGPLSMPHTVVVVGPPTVGLGALGLVNAANQSSYVVSGTCTSTAGAVSLFVGSVSEMTPCTSAGSFTASVDVSSLPQGAVPVSASQTNASGTRSAMGMTSKDSVAPSTPVLTSPGAGSFGNDPTPTLTGTAEPGSSVRVTIGGMTVCSAVAPPSGVWSCVVSMLSDGVKTVVAEASDQAGNTSAPSAGRELTIDTMAPDAPVIGSPSAGGTTGLSPVLNGSAEPLARVRVVEGGSVVCEVAADTTGRWTCPTILGEGPHTISATQTDRAGNVSPATMPRAFRVENRPTVLIDALEPINIERAAMYKVRGFCTTGSGAVTVTILSASAMAPCVMGRFEATVDTQSVPDARVVAVGAAQRTAGGAGQDSKNTIKDTVAPNMPTLELMLNDGVTTSNQPTFGGQSEPNSVVTIFINGVPVGTATADAMGQYSFTPAAPLAEGAYGARASATDAVGNLGPETEPLNFAVDSVAPRAPLITTPVAQEGLASDRPFLFAGTAEPGARVTVYVDGQPLGTGTADRDGRFSVSVPASDIAVGSHRVTAEARDAAGNVGPRAVEVPFTVIAIDSRFAGQGLIGCSGAGMSLVPGLLLVLAAGRRRRAKRHRSMVALVVLFGATALAQPSQEPTALPPFSLERFNLSEVGRGGLAVSSGDVLPRFKLRLFAAVHYENNPLVYYRGQTRVGALVEHRLTTHIGVGFGLTSWLTVAGELPLVVFQRGQDLRAEALTLPPNSFAVGSPRLAVRVGVVSQYGGGLVADGPFDLALQLGTALPVGMPGALAVESGVALFPQLSVGRDVGPVRLGGEVTGLVRLAPTVLTGSNPLGQRDAVGTQLAVRLLLASTGPGARFEGSVHSGFALGGPTQRTPPGFEVLVGGRLPLGPLEAFVLGGPGFGSLPGTPTFRVLGGIGLRPELGRCSADTAHAPSQCPDLDDDADSVLNAVDSCPLQPEDIDSFQDSDGCPDVDNDGDTVLDGQDQCPLKAGPVATRGCPTSEKDSDKDGVLDSRDECPKVPGLAERAGCPIVDSDKDGLEDDVDACPTEAGPREKRGCPSKDRDSDGVLNAVDNCPDVAGAAENQGCPVKDKQLVVITSDKLAIKDKVFFATGKSNILPKSFLLLNQVAKVLREHPELPVIVIEGHTDNAGQAELNRKLSRGRAVAVKKYLVFQGVDEARLSAVGFGPDRPTDTNATEVGRANNRRVEFMLETAAKTPVKP
jgi:outer membrane protein OmpA-like peptidoglycan-associated protein